MSHPAELARGIVMPVQVYPMFETALRAAAGEERRRAPGADVRAVVAVLGGGRRQPVRLGAAGADAPRRSARPGRTTG